MLIIFHSGRTSKRGDKIITRRKEKREIKLNWKNEESKKGNKVNDIWIS